MPRPDRPRPVNVSAVTDPRWTGAQRELAIGVSRGEPRRTDAQMADAVRDQVRRYLAAHPPLTPLPAPVLPVNADLLAEHLVRELVRPEAVSIMVFREHLLMHLGIVLGMVVAHGRAVRAGAVG